MVSALNGSVLSKWRVAPLNGSVKAISLASSCSDGSPGTMTAYFNAAADRLGLPRPAQVTMEQARMVMTPLMISYFSESRLVDNRKMLDQLGITLLYPNLEAGLQP